MIRYRYLTTTFVSFSISIERMSILCVSVDQSLYPIDLPFIKTDMYAFLNTKHLTETGIQTFWKD